MANRTWTLFASLVLLGLGPMAPWESKAQNTLKWATNHYFVTGATVSQIRHSLDHARPGGRGAKTDGVTDWKVSWRFRVESTEQGCRVASFTTDTTITLTMPAWNASPQADPAVKKAWARYYGALLRHEVGHAQMAQQAEVEIRKRVDGISSARDCPTLRQNVTAAAQAVLTEYRQRDAEYDRRTRHSFKEGAHFP